MGKHRIPEPSEYCIYALENKVNGKKYIGQTQDLSWRKVTHRGYLKNGKHANYKLQKDWNKYGEKAFEFFVIEYCDRSVANEREMYYISLFDTVNNGYNISIGGTTGNNFPRKKIKQYDMDGNFIKLWESAAEAARYYNVARCRISRAVKKKGTTLDSQWCYEDEDINGYYMRKKQRPLAQYDLDGNLISVYKNLTDSSLIENGFSKAFVSKAANSDGEIIAYQNKWKFISKEVYYEYSKRCD